ncbi:MAG: lysylphosphatidylglycerol synthase domain-containing protein [Geminicoccales bacterium]
MPKSVSIIGLIVGLFLTVGLLVWSDIGQVLQSLSTAGFGLLLVFFLAPPEAMLSAEAWRRLFPDERRPAYWQTLRASWMGAAVNALLPVATIGGEMVKARVLMLGKMPGNDVVAATIVDKTVQAIVILVWGLIGLLVLACLAPDENLLWGGLISASLFGFGIAGFIWAQLAGSFSFLAKSGARLMQRSSGEGEPASSHDLDQAIRAVYRRPGVIAKSAALRLTSQIWLVSEVLLATYLLGHAVGLEEAIMLRALIGAVRGFSFVIPAGLGLQEGAYIALGALIGLPADVMLALSLASRLREIGPNIPFLIAWQHLEGGQLWRWFKTKSSAFA